MGLRLLSYRKNMWLRMMCCLQIIWWENRKSQWRSWSAAIPRGEEGHGSSWLSLAQTSSHQLLRMTSEQCSVACYITSDSEP